MRRNTRSSQRGKGAGKRSPQAKAKQQTTRDQVWLHRLWLGLGAAGLFLSGSLIGSVIGTQVEREKRIDTPTGADADVMETPTPSYIQRKRSTHALTLFLPVTPPEIAPARPEPRESAEEEAIDTQTGLAPPAPPQMKPPTSLAARPDPPLAWQSHAVQVAQVPRGPAIAVVIDDLGLNLPNTRRAIGLPAPLTLAFMTYGFDLKQLTAAARRAGHELLVHVPMEPLDRESDPGPNVLRTSSSQADLERSLDWGLSRFDGYVGINNHMGSKFTASSRAMTFVMLKLKSRGLMFLDSQTIPGSVGAEAAEDIGIPYAMRDVFLDNVAEPAAIRKQLGQLERIAKRRGFAVGIGHPFDSTLDVLSDWIPEAEARGFTLVPISYIARRRMADG